MVALKGLAFPLTISSRGSFQQKTGIEKIKDNIKALILTSLGERLMSPQVGCLGYSYLFRALSSEEVSILKHHLIMGLEASETRITVVDVDVRAADREGRLLIDMTFKLDTYSDLQDVTIQIEE
tara:strand:- start:2114 stop:2485 length:372 start_codon:yes stop_codon:yes gene_type:complete